MINDDDVKVVPSPTKGAELDPAPFNIITLLLMNKIQRKRVKNRFAFLPLKYRLSKTRHVFQNLECRQ